MTDNSLPNVPDPSLDTDQAVLDRPSSSVSAFVAAAITEHRRNHGFSQLIADLDAAAEPTPTGRAWARDALEGS